MKLKPKTIIKNSEKLTKIERYTTRYNIQAEWISKHDNEYRKCSPQFYLMPLSTHRQLTNFKFDYVLSWCYSWTNTQTKKARTNLKRRSICLCNWTNLKLYIVYTYITSLQILIYLYIPLRIVHGYVWFIVHVILCKSSFLQPCNRCFKHNIIFLYHRIFFND